MSNTGSSGWVSLICAYGVCCVLHHHTHFLFFSFILFYCFILAHCKIWSILWQWIYLVCFRCTYLRWGIQLDVQYIYFLLPNLNSWSMESVVLLALENIPRVTHDVLDEGKNRVEYEHQRSNSVKVSWEQDFSEKPVLVQKDSVLQANIVKLKSVCASV